MGIKAHLSTRAKPSPKPTREDREMATKRVRVSRPWARQTPRVSFPITIIKPNGERFIVAPTGKRVAKRKAKPKSKRVAKQLVKVGAQVSKQDEQAIALAERQEAFKQAQARLEREMRGDYL